MIGRGCNCCFRLWRLGLYGTDQINLGKTGVATGAFERCRAMLPNQDIRSHAAVSDRTA